MGLDVYVGSLTRYFCREWETVVQQHGKAMGLPVEIVREKGEPEDAIRNPEVIRPLVRSWRDGLSAALESDLPNPLDWDESSEAPYFTDKPTWDCYGALMVWAAYDEHPELVRPIGAIDDWGEDPAYQASSTEEIASRYRQLFGATLWLPCTFEFTFTTTSLTDEELCVGSSQALLAQLVDLNRRTWCAPVETLEEWRREGAEYGCQLELSARFAFSVLHGLAEQSVQHRLPMKLDW